MKKRAAFLHYSAPPVVGGVESVILAHAQWFLRSGFDVSVLSGRGEPEALPGGVHSVHLALLDSQHPKIIAASQELEQGRIPSDFEDLVSRLQKNLEPLLPGYDTLIVHNVFTKHFNLPLTAALFRMLDSRVLPGCTAWCHDFTWTSPNSRSKVFPGYPWDLLRTRHPRVRYVTVSKKRRTELAGLLGCPAEEIEVIYNGVDPAETIGLSTAGVELAERLGLLDADLVLIMPVRVTQAKNIELGLGVAAEIKARGLQVRLVVTGPPDPHDAGSLAYFNSLLALRRRLGVEEEACFIYESGPDPQQGYTIDTTMVGELLRLSDALLMASHREGFGMPVLEAGLLGIPVFSTAVPAAVEIGGDQVVGLSPEDSPEEVAAKILAWAENSSLHHLRRRVRQNYTWDSLLKAIAR